LFAKAIPDRQLAFATSRAAARLCGSFLAYNTQSRVECKARDARRPELGFLVDGAAIRPLASIKRRPAGGFFAPRPAAGTI
jgi:hypothetical protein